MTTRRWEILTYESSSGDKPVDDFIKKQQSRGRAKIAHAVRLLREYGNILSMPHSKSLGEGLHELRIRRKEELRIFIALDKRPFIYYMYLKNKSRERHKRN
jgi:hypothetical protein